MPRQRITLALLRALIDAGVAIDANAIHDLVWEELVRHAAKTVIAVSTNANGPNGALFASGNKLYAVIGRTGRLVQVI